MKALCIVDTCSLIYWRDIQLARRSLYRWLWDEFEVRYSRAVLDEIQRNKNRIAVRRNWERYVWEYHAISTCERALFASPLPRHIETGTCRQCGQTVWRDQFFEPDLTGTQDKGERHNCCVALDIVSKGKYRRQVIFLTDDRRAIRDYVKPVFETFPLGQIWTSLDFVLYLFVRHRSRIPLDEVVNVLRDVNAQSPEGQAQRMMRRLTLYRGKAQRIDRVLAQIQGGY